MPHLRQLGHATHAAEYVTWSEMRPLALPIGGETRLLGRLRFFVAKFRFRRPELGGRAEAARHRSLARLRSTPHEISANLSLSFSQYFSIGRNGVQGHSSPMGGEFLRIVMIVQLEATILRYHVACPTPTFKFTVLYFQI